LKVIDKKDLKQTAGRMIMIYGGTGAGKTTSVLQSSPDPIFYIQTEPRTLQPSIKAASRPDLRLKVGVYETYPDLMGVVNNLDNFKGSNTLVVDSLSQLVAVSIPSEITNEAFEAKSERDRQIKPLVSTTKLSIEGYGALSSTMFRLTSALGRISQAGKIVVCTALLQENPRYNRELAAAPLLKGREYPAAMPGYFDLIGLVTSRVNEAGEVIYPPRVQFQSPDDSFVAKFTGTGNKTQGPLDISKIIKTT
jgi:hypothetical protein